MTIATILYSALGFARSWGKVLTITVPYVKHAKDLSSLGCAVFY